MKDHWNAEKAGDARTDQTYTAGPSATHWLAVHHQYGDDVGGNLEPAGQECVEIDIAVKCSRVKCQSVVD